LSSARRPRTSASSASLDDGAGLEDWPEASAAAPISDADESDGRPHHFTTVSVTSTFIVSPLTLSVAVVTGRSDRL
jgi:hypothetical protein